MTLQCFFAYRSVHKTKEKKAPRPAHWPTQLPSGPDLALWITLSGDLLHLWAAGVRGGASPSGPDVITNRAGPKPTCSPKHGAPVMAAWAACPAGKQKAWAAVLHAAYKNKGCAQWASRSPMWRVGRSAAAWSSHRTCPWRACLAAKSPWFWATAGYPRWVSAMVQHLGCQKPKTRPMTRCHEYVYGNLFGQKKYCVTHMFAMQLWWTNMRDGQVGKMEKWRGERAVERSRTGDSVVVIVVRQGCSRWGSLCHCHGGSAGWCAAAWSWHPNTAPEHTA